MTQDQQHKEPKFAGRAASCTRMPASGATNITVDTVQRRFVSHLWWAAEISNYWARERGPRLRDVIRANIQE